MNPLHKPFEFPCETWRFMDGSQTRGLHKPGQNEPQTSPIQVKIKFILLFVPIPTFKSSFHNDLVQEQYKQWPFNIREYQYDVSLQYMVLSHELGLK